MSKSQSIELIEPGWLAPANVRAVTTTRKGGVSSMPYGSLNLALHVGDDPELVAINRHRLHEHLGFDINLYWLSQIHSKKVINVSNIDQADTNFLVADAWVCFEPGKACGVLTADCLPVFFCDRQGTRVGVAHVGWRGLSGGIIEEMIARLDCSPSELLAWLGPAISAHAYQVGEEVREIFVSDYEKDALAFTPDNTGTWRADLYALATNRLRRLGVFSAGGCHCTFYDAGRFYSYRRDGCTGRMASLIWLDPNIG